MNIYLLEHFLRWVGMLFVSFISIFNVGTYDEYVLNVDNKNMDFGILHSGAAYTIMPIGK